MIREATQDDIPRLATMGRHFFLASGYADMAEYDPETVVELLSGLIEADTAVLLVSEHEGEVVGMVGGVLFPLFFNQSKVVAQELFWWVNDRARGSGAGTELLQGFEAWAESAGASGVMMMGLSKLAPDKVASFYERHGYRESERTYLKVV